LRYPLRPTFVSAALALVAHATLLTLATLVGFRLGTPQNLIRVWLVSGGGNAAAAVPGGDAQPGVALPAPLAALAPDGSEHHRDVPRAKPHAHVHPRAREPRALRDVTVPSAVTASAGENGSGSDSKAGAASAAGTGLPGDGSGGSGPGGPGTGEGGDQRAYCVYCPEPHYPLIARARGWQGSVDVGLFVLADGSVHDASLRRSSGYSALDEAALAVARQSRFRPPFAGGLPAPLRGRIEYRFELTAAH